jgi:hypothetical protein
MIKPDLFAYYAPDTQFLAQLAQSFEQTGRLDPEAFYLVLDWKAARARKKHLARLTKLAGSFNKAVHDIATGLSKSEDAECLRLLMTKWGFRLPTATAILTALYPNKFTVYDVRVCRALGSDVENFERLSSLRWSSELWENYKRFIKAVERATPPALSLRDRDRWLWGKDKRRGMLDELSFVVRSSKFRGTRVR